MNAGPVTTWLWLFAAWTAAGSVAAQTSPAAATPASWPATEFLTAAAEGTNFDRDRQIPVTSSPERLPWTLTYGPYNRHTGPGNFNCHPQFTSLEVGRRGHWSLGASHFVNSFSQSCWFAHASRQFVVGGREQGFFAKFTCGLMYGYRSPHQDSVPLNFRGFNPAVIPSAGYQWKHSAVHLAVYGKNAGQMLLFSHSFQ
jgi:hypothetical protein